LIGGISEKGCAFSACHAGETQAHGLRLDSPGAVFDALSTRPDALYAMLASGRMPKDGTAWSEEDLRLFRSWYCDGGFPR
jgi:hypothetical protein